MVAPFAWTFYLSREFTVPMPKGDHWSIAGRSLARSIEGTLTLSDLWAQDNDSRMMVPRILHIGMARATGWDVKAETALCVILAFLAVFGAWRLMRRTFPGSRGYQVAAVLGLAVLVASPMQWMNWTFGVIIAYFTVVLPAVLVVTVFSTAWHYGIKLALGIFLALAATQSFICGWIVWVEVAALALWTRPLPRPALRWSLYALFLVAGVIYGLWYFQGYKMGGGVGHVNALSMAGAMMVFFLGLVGAPFSEMLPVANSAAGPWIGAISLGWLALSLYLLGTRTRREIWFLAWPWLVMCGWSLSVLGMIAFGRAQLDPQAAYWSRYMAFSAWFHGANLVLALMTWQHAVKGLAKHQALAWKGAGLLLAAGFSWQYVQGARFGVRSMEDDFLSTLQVRAGIHFMAVVPEHELLKRNLFPLEWFLPRARDMRSKGMFHEPEHATDKVEALPPAAEGRARGGVTKVQISDPGGGEIRGWAWDNVKQRPVDAVVLAVPAQDGGWRIFGLAQSQPIENKIAKREKLSGFNNRIGWRYRFSSLPDGFSPESCRVYAYDTEEHSLALLGDAAVEKKK
jgi:hypothetical protein